MGRDPLGRERRVSLKDIADETGFSITTVSRSLTAQGRISEQTRQAVLEVAERLGYVPNLLAQDLRRPSARFIGFIVPDIRSPTYSVAAEEFSLRVSQAGWRMLLAVTANDPDREAAELADLVGAQAAGIVIAPTPEPTRLTRQLLQTVPTIEFNRTAGLSGSGVFFNDHGAIANAVAYLVEQGHQQVALISTSGNATNSHSRLAGYQQGMRAAGLGDSSRLVRLVDAERLAGYEAARELLLTTRRPSALIVAGNELSIGVSRALADLPHAVTAATSVVLYGDPEWTGTLYPVCPTIAVPNEAMADAVADMMLTCMKENGTLPERQVFFEGDLRLRSTPPAPHRPPGKEVVAARE